MEKYIHIFSGEIQTRADWEDEFEEGFDEDDGCYGLTFQEAVDKGFFEEV